MKPLWCACLAVAATLCSCDEPLRFEPPPYFRQGALMVPAEPLANWLDVELKWDRGAGKIEFRQRDADGTSLALQVGTKQARVGGSEKPVSWPPEVKAGVAFVPLRPVAEAFAVEVYWSEAAGEVVLRHGERTAVCRLSDQAPPKAGRARVWATERDHPGRPRGVAVSADGSLAAALYRQGRIDVWNLSTGGLVRTWQAEGTWLGPEPVRLVFSGDGTRLLVAGRFQAELFRARTADSLWRKEFATEDGDALVAVAPDASALAVATITYPKPDRHARQSEGPVPPVLKGVDVYQLPSGKRIWKLDKRVTAPEDLAIASGGALLAMDTAEEGITLWEIPSGKTRSLKREADDEGTGSLFLADGGKLILRAGTAWTYPELSPVELPENDSCVLAWPAAQGKALALFGGWDQCVASALAGEPTILGGTQPHLAPATCAALSADGHIVVTGAGDGTVRAWDVTTGCELLDANKSDAIVELGLKAGTAREFEIEFHDVPTPVKDAELKLDLKAYYDEDVVELPEGLAFETLSVKGASNSATAKIRIKVAEDVAPGWCVCRVHYRFSFVDWAGIGDECVRVFRVHVFP